MGLPIMTVCNNCTLQLRTAKARLDVSEELNNKVNGILEKSRHPYKYQGTFEITHFLRVLDAHPELLDGKHPQSFERLVKKLGADCVNFSDKRKCCGFHAQLAAEDDVLKITGEIVDSAGKAEADSNAIN